MTERTAHQPSSAVTPEKTAVPRPWFAATSAFGGMMAGVLILVMSQLAFPGAVSSTTAPAGGYDAADSGTDGDAAPVVAYESGADESGAPDGGQMSAPAKSDDAAADLADNRADSGTVAPLVPLAALQRNAEIAAPQIQETTSTDDRTEEPMETASLGDTADTAASTALDGVALADNPEEPAIDLSSEDMPAETEIRVVEVQRGDTLMDLLTRAGAPRRDAYEAIEALSDHYDPRKIRVGQKLEVTLAKFDEAPLIEPDAFYEEVEPTLVNLSMRPDVERFVTVKRADDGNYASEQADVPLREAFYRAAGTIDSSLYLAAEQAGVPAAVIIEMIRMYSYDVDFQREIRKGDKFELFFSRYYDPDNQPVKTGEIYFGSMTTGGKTRNLWRYTPTDDGQTDYFDEDGRSMKKFLMKTPIDGARLSSNFGMRRHPVLGYSKMHTGTDFAAPRGTPIYAAGNGVVERANRFGSYGNYIMIRHANGYKTAYAHLNGFAKGIRAGKRVSQGQVIGYVGTTGRSTGPHLHYEVHHNGKRVNPMQIRVPTGRTLAKAELNRFQARREQIDLMIAQYPVNATVQTASLPPEASAN